MRQCIVCSKKFSVRGPRGPKEGRGPRAKTCSSRCTEQVYLRRLAEERVERRKRIKVSCEGCDRPFEKSASDNKKKFCSASCRSLTRKERDRKIEPRDNCAQCGGPILRKAKRLVTGRTVTGGRRRWILASAQRTKFCSNRCAWDYGNPRRKRHQRACIICRKNFIGTKHQRYCSPKCVGHIPHPSRRKDIAGQRFGRLVAIRSEVRKRDGRPFTWWLCQCDCGTRKWIVITALGAKRPQKSCGCLVREKGHKRGGLPADVRQTCIICDEFFMGHPDRDTCSDECRRKQRANVERAWRIANREHIKEYKKRYETEILSNPKGEKQWLQRSRLELTRVRNLLAGKAGAVAVTKAGRNEPLPPHRKASPSQKPESTPHSNSRG